MAHPYASHRQNSVERSRVSKITKGYATGGAVEMEDDDMPGPSSGDTGRKAMKRGGKPKMKMEGKSAKHHMGKRKRGGKVIKADDDHSARMEDDEPTPGRKSGGKVACREDGGIVRASGYKRGGKIAKGEKTAPMEDGDMPKRAEGGRVKKPGQTIVNVMVADKGESSPMPPQQVPVKVPVPVPAPPPQMAGPPPGAMPPGGGMPPGGMPPGAVPSGMLGRAKGGRVAKGTATYEDSLKNGTQVSHSPGKNDLGDIRTSKPITYARGGATDMGMTAGAGTGEGRLQKIKAYGGK